MRLQFDETGSKFYEYGLDRGVLYPISNTGAYNYGVSWEGLTGANEQPSGAEPQKFYADNIKYATLLSAEDYKLTIEAYQSPSEFDECDGSASLATGIKIGQQARKKFGFAYRTKKGNDIDNELGYVIHLAYGCSASPSGKDHKTINDNPDLDTLSWEVNCDPVNVTGYKPTCTIEIDSTEVSAANLKALEDVLYGIDAAEFSATSTYALGDYVTHETKTYKCTTAVTVAGTWDATNWTEVTNPDAHLPLPDEILTIITAG